MEKCQKNVIEFRNKVLEILQNELISINERIEKILALCNAKVLEQHYKKIIKAFLSFERLEKAWTKRLKNIKNQPFNKIVQEELSPYCQRFLVNSIYRHLSGAEDTMWVRARLIGCIVSWWVIQTIILQETKKPDSFDIVVDVVRAYSAEVEYSEKNLDKLFSYAYKFIKL